MGPYSTINRIETMGKITHCATVRVLHAAVLILGLSGCGSTAPKPEQNPSSGAYDSLYSGKSDIAFATRMPIVSVGEAVAAGDAAFREGDTDKALFEYTLALKKGGDDADVLYKIGLIHAARDNTQLAELAFRWALKDQSDHAGALTGLGILLTNKRQYRQAEKTLQKAVGLNPRMPRAYNALGVLADMGRDYPQAQAYYQKALAVAPSSPGILNNLGFSRYLDGKPDAAIAAFESALKIKPDYRRAWRNLALVYAREEKYRQAVDALAKVEDLHKAYNDVGYVAMVGGRLSEAESFFDEAMRLSPRYYQLADANLQRVNSMRSVAASGR